ncbi:MAG: hypothetical protein KDA27_11415 [Candidatus Eisenbacteria bacterium]|uniref:Non-specific protein-tyrosine kinase n=1 Tax=Eiseniibacteriota bacterium TaxID=2212470 RepID=A0A956NBX8_UNCEI|nr:hypothetical protein [Candidatus Eisenbacteria bacterium]
METQPRLKETVDLRSYGQLLWRRKWMVILPTLIAGVAGIILTMPRFMQPLYRCSATLSIELPTPLTRELSGMVANPSLMERLLRLENQVQSSDFLAKVIDNTGMRDDMDTKRWAEKNQKKYPDMSMDELISLRLERYLRQAIRLKTADEGNQIQVSAIDTEPDRCYRLVRSLCSGIIEASRSVHLDVLRSTEEYSQAQLLEWKRQLDDAEAKLETFQRNRAYGTVTPGLVGDANLTTANEQRRFAESDLTRVQGEAASIAARLRASGVSTAALDGLLQQDPLRGFLARGQKLERDYVRQTLSGTTGEMSPETIAIQVSRLLGDARAAAAGSVASLAPNGVGEATDYLVARLQTELARTRYNEFDQEIRKYQGRITSAPQASLEEQRLTQEVISLRQIYEAFEKQITTSQLTVALDQSKAGEKIAVVEPPQQPLKPFKPRRAPMIALGFIAGMAIGVLGAFVLEHHDQSFRDIRDTEERLGVRVVGTIPGIEGISKGAALEPEKQKLAYQDFLDDSPGYQEFRKAALAVLRAGPSGPRSLLITSARSEEGKSTASTCLALTLAKELPNERIVLVDLDARKPAISKRLGLELGPQDAGTILREQRWIDGVAQPWIRPNLAVLPMDNTSDASEYITKERVRWLLGELMQRYHRIIIDSPPNLPVPDPLVLGPEVDAVLMVVKAGTTPREMVRRSLDLQREFQDNVIGVLMNDMASALPYYYSYKHYGYGYGQKKQARG